MNLHDIVRRRDRMLLVESGTVEAADVKAAGGSYRAVDLSRGTCMRLVGAHEATALRAFPTSPGWEVVTGDPSGLEVHLGDDGADVFRGRADTTAVGLSWPLPCPREFDLVVRTEHDVRLSVGPLFDARSVVLPHLRGRGVEVGPGPNPAVLPAPGREVVYVERMALSDWAATYAHGHLDPSKSDLWARYIVDSATELETAGDGSLDFIFSSHVLEHIVNPLQLLANWWRKLAPGGVIAGVVPDCRFTFDLRQPVSTPADWLQQYAKGGFAPTEHMYERWCRYTQPKNTPESLRARDYSIHVNYYTPESLRLLFDLFAEIQGVAGMHLRSVRNGKDFAFLIAKP